jgi:hypothetical protein
MEISCKRRRRQVYNQQLIADMPDISGIGLPESRGYDRFRTIRMEQDSKALVITSLTPRIALGGHFWITVKLTNKEIANLARVAFADTPFGEVVKLLRKRRITGRKSQRSQGTSIWIRRRANREKPAFP